MIKYKFKYKVLLHYYILSALRVLIIWSLNWRRIYFKKKM